jgi:hypothetical protein
MIQGQQFRFSRADWKSEQVPKPGLVVELELDRNLEVVSVRASPELQLGGEHAPEGCSRQAGLNNNGGSRLRKVYEMFFGREAGGKAVTKK